MLSVIPVPILPYLVHTTLLKLSMTSPPSPKSRSSSLPLLLLLLQRISASDAHGALTFPPPRNNHNNIAPTNLAFQKGSNAGASRQGGSCAGDSCLWFNEVSRNVFSFLFFSFLFYSFLFLSCLFLSCLVLSAIFAPPLPFTHPTLTITC